MKVGTMVKMDKTSSHGVFGCKMYHLKCNVCGVESSTSDKKMFDDDVGSDCCGCKVVAHMELKNRLTDGFDRDLTDDEYAKVERIIGRLERVVDYKCPDCDSKVEVRKGNVVEPDGKNLYVYRCKDCGYMWDNNEYGGDKNEK